MTQRDLNQPQRGIAYGWPATWDMGDERLALARQALEQMAGRIASGEYAGHEYATDREEPFGSVPHALAMLFHWRTAGVSPGSVANLDDHAAYIAPRKGDTKMGYMPQWTKKRTPPGYLRRAEMMHTVAGAFASAYETLPRTGGVLGRRSCELALLLRYVGEQTPRSTAAYVAHHEGYFASPEEALPYQEIGTDKHGKPVMAKVLIGPVTAKMIGRVTRHGYDRVYEFLREREMVPARRRGKAA